MCISCNALHILQLQVVSQRLIDRDPEEDSGAGGAGGPPLVEEPMDFSSKKRNLFIKHTHLI